MQGGCDLCCPKCQHLCQEFVKQEKIRLQKDKEEQRCSRRLEGNRVKPWVSRNIAIPSIFQKFGSGSHCMMRTASVQMAYIAYIEL